MTSSVRLTPATFSRGEGLRGTGTRCTGLMRKWSERSGSIQRGSLRRVAEERITMDGRYQMSTDDFIRQANACHLLQRRRLTGKGLNGIPLLRRIKPRPSGASSSLSCHLKHVVRRTSTEADRTQREGKRRLRQRWPGSALPPTRLIMLQNRSFPVRTRSAVSCSRSSCAFGLLSRGTSCFLRSLRSGSQ